MCGWRAIFGFREVRTRILDSFCIEAAPPAYYTQFVFAHGVTVKASSDVSPEALVKAAESATRMMVGLRHDMRTCMTGAAVAIFPKDDSLVSLPEFAYLKGETAFTSTGALYDDLPGIGPRGDQLVAATEWDLLLERNAGSITMHEFAHIVELCFTREDHAELSKIYGEALQAGAFPGSYAMTNESEFFAETSLAYFNAPIHDWGLAENQSFQDALRTTLPQTFAFLERVYGEPPAR